MESSMIDTSSKRSKKKPCKRLPRKADDSSADRVIRDIISDNVEWEHHLSAFDLINDFRRYQASLEKFGLSEEDLFDRLALKNKRVELFQVVHKEKEESGKVQEE